MKSYFIYLFIVFMPIISCGQSEKTQHLTKFVRNITYNGVVYVVCEIDLKKHTVDWFDNSYNFDKVEKESNRKGDKLVFEMNSGYYNEHYKPNGLVLDDGIVKNSLSLDSKFEKIFPTGVFVVNKSNKATIIPANKMINSPIYETAIQTGPILVLNNKNNMVNSALKGEFVQNGIGVNKYNKVFFVVSKSPISYVEFANFFIDVLSVNEALVVNTELSEWYTPGIGKSKTSKKMGGILSVLEKNKDSEPSSDPLPDIEHEELNKNIKRISFNGKSYIVCTANLDENSISLFNEINEKTLDVHDFRSIERTLKKTNKEVVFSMNAGMYNEQLKPIGLFIFDQYVYQDINLNKDGYGNFYSLPPNGVFSIDVKGKAMISTSQSFVTKYKETKELLLATQSGPMMVIDGNYNAAFNKGSKNLNIRNGVGVNKNGDVFFIISEDKVNFYEFSELFKKVFLCNNALYLDGVISQWYAPGLKGFNINMPKLGPILTVHSK